MNVKAKKFHRSNIENFPESVDTPTDKLIQEIVDNTNQMSVNKIDEVRLMQSMLNDKQFKVAIHERGKGFTGSRSPRDTAISLAVDTLSGIVGMSGKEAKALAENYEFTKKDAQRFVDISKDFIGTYMQSGRKINIVSEPRGEISIGLKYIEAHNKSVPDGNSGTKVIKTEDRLKLSVTNKR